MWPRVWAIQSYKLTGFQKFIIVSEAIWEGGSLMSSARVCSPLFCDFVGHIENSSKSCLVQNFNNILHNSKKLFCLTTEIRKFVLKLMNYLLWKPLDFIFLLRVRSFTKEGLRFLCRRYLSLTTLNRDEGRGSKNMKLRDVIYGRRLTA